MAPLRNFELAKNPAEARAQNPPPATNTPQILFLDLSAEIHLSIYQLLYKRESEIWLTGPLAHRGVEDRIETALFLTCRKIHDEASAVLYKENTFAVNGLAGSLEILEKLKAPACSYMKHLKVQSIPMKFFGLEAAVVPGPLVVGRHPLPAPQINSSIWNCLTHHLQKLETIEIGTLGPDFFFAIARLTTTTWLVRVPPPTIELEISVNSSLPSQLPVRASGGRFQSDVHPLWLPAVDCIRLVGRLNPYDCKRLQGSLYPHYMVVQVEEMEANERFAAYGDHSGVLITLEEAVRR